MSAGDARCGRHPEREARGPCARCGDFVCAECDGSVDGSRLCGACLAVALDRVTPAARSLRRLAWTYYVLAGLVSLTCLSPLAVIGARDESLAGAGDYAWAFVVVVVGMVSLLSATGWGLARLRAWAVVPAMGLATLMLFAVPLGTLIGGEALYTLIRHRSLLTGEAGLLRAVPSAGKERIPRWQLAVIAMLLFGIVAFLAMTFL